MKPLYDVVSQGLIHSWKPVKAAKAGRAYRCRCSRPVFFRNSECLACHAPLGFEPLLGELGALQPGDAEGLWRLENGDGAQYRRCANFEQIGCNWLIPADSDATLCLSCVLNRTIPDLSEPENLAYWQSIEIAKRQLVAQLLALGLPVRSKVSDDPDNGLCFDFLKSLPDGPRVLTGHDEGLITLNVEEADDARREAMRKQLGEPYRTLLGHLRHEVGHYYWDVLVRDSHWLEPYRALFGDESFDYATALQQHYENGPPADWPQQFVSAYATSHPWEDWAETWAHYLHLVDTMNTALAFGLNAEDVEVDTEPFGSDALYDPQHPGAGQFLYFINAWVDLVTILNELSRSMGQRDFYPFVMSRPVVAKLHFIHLVIEDARDQHLQAQDGGVEAATTMAEPVAS